MIHRRRQLQVWKDSELILDVEARDPGFPLAAGEGRHFIARSKVFTATELPMLGEADEHSQMGAVNPLNVEALGFARVWRGL